MSGQVLESLHDIVSAEHPTYIGGGTDIMPLLKNEVRDDKDFVFLKKIPELHVLEEKDGELIIGAAMTLTELAESELLNSRCAAIAQAAYLNKVPYLVIRAISDKADGSAGMDYAAFEAKAIEHSVKLLMEMVARL